jgi:hypothetical protein
VRSLISAHIAIVFKAVLAFIESVQLCHKSPFEALESSVNLVFAELLVR